VFVGGVGVVFVLCGDRSVLWNTKQSVFWPFGKRGMELLILDKKERGAESQYYSGESGESRA